jgi:hypothetical protein
MQKLTLEKTAFILPQRLFGTTALNVHRVVRRNHINKSTNLKCTYEEVTAFFIR